MRVDFLSPLFLSKNIGTLPQNVDNGSLFANSIDFLNPNKAPMLVDQLRFAISNTSYLSDYFNLDVEIRAGATPLTNGRVPLLALCPVYRDAAEFMFVWHLPKPLYLPRDVGISASVYRRTLGQGEAIGPVGVSVAGRSVPQGWPVPKHIFVPWAAATVCDEDTTEWVSNDSDLVNAHDEPLVLQQLLGYSRGPNDGRYSPIYVQATTSQNRVLVRDPTPFSLLFPPSRRMLNMSGVLMPKEFIRASLTVQPPQDATSDDATVNLTVLGMVGYRKIQTPWGAPAK